MKMVGRQMCIQPDMMVWTGCSIEESLRKAHSHRLPEIVSSSVECGSQTIQPCYMQCSQSTRAFKLLHLIFPWSTGVACFNVQDDQLHDSVHMRIHNGESIIQKKSHRPVWTNRSGITLSRVVENLQQRWP